MKIEIILEVTEEMESRNREMEGMMGLEMRTRKSHGNLLLVR